MKNYTHRLKTLLLIFATSVLPLSSLANPAVKDDPKVSTQRINDSFYVINGGNGLGANAGVLIQDEGVLLVDSMNIHKESHEQLYRAIRQITDKPIRYVFNTHSHRDHSGGNAFFAEKGAIIITQENSDFIKTPTYSTLNFRDKLTLKFGNEVIEAFHVLSHTTNDAIIRFKHNNAVFTGDNHATTWGPATGYMGIKGMLKVLNLSINLSDESTHVVPGHGDIVDKAHLKKFKADSLVWHDHILKQDRKGMSSESLARDAKVKSLFEPFNGKKSQNFMTEDMRLRRIKWHLIDSKVQESDVAMTAVEIEKMAGQYPLKNGELAEVYAERGRLYLRIKNKYFTELLPRQNGKFEFRGWENNEHAIFSFPKNSVTTIKIVMKDDSVTGKRHGIFGR